MLERTTPRGRRGERTFAHNHVIIFFDSLATAGGNPSVMLVIALVSRLEFEVTLPIRELGLEVADLSLLPALLRVWSAMMPLCC